MSASLAKQVQGPASAFRSMVEDEDAALGEDELEEQRSRSRTLSAWWTSLGALKCRARHADAVMRRRLLCGLEQRLVGQVEAMVSIFQHVLVYAFVVSTNWLFVLSAFIVCGALTGKPYGILQSYC